MKEYEELFHFRETERQAWPLLSIEARLVYLNIFIRENWPHELVNMEMLSMVIADAACDGHDTSKVGEELRRSGIAKPSGLPVGRHAGENP